MEKDKGHSGGGGSVAAVIMGFGGDVGVWRRMVVVWWS